MMPHHTPLIATIVVGLVLAFCLGALAHRLRASPLVGYLLAGVLMGPFTPGFVADQDLADQLAEIGVILLMFGVGLHFSLKDLLSVRAHRDSRRDRPDRDRDPARHGARPMRSAGPSAPASCSASRCRSPSTVVLLRALQERRLIETERGRIAVGWLIVEDIAMVLALVLLPALAGILKGQTGADWAHARRCRSLITLGKVAAFVALMLIVGRRVIPWILHYVAHTGSRELFRLAVLAIALGVAYGAAHAVRRVVRARRLLRRHDPERIRAEPARRRGDAAAARRLRGAVLRLGRHAVRPDDRAARLGCRCSRRC